jgi:hypothetical protein
MSHEHIAAVWEHSRQSGSHLLVLVAVASDWDPNGEWIASQATLQSRVRLTNRRVRQILTDLVASGELAVTSHHGRGKLSAYRLLVGQENWKKSASPPGRKEAASSRSTGQPQDAVSRFSSQGLDAESQYPAPPVPPSPPNPHIPPYPPDSKKADMESFALALRPLTGPQSATHRASLILEEAGIPLPSPAQIGLWLRTLGGIEPLLELLRRLIHAGLATKRNPAAYVHRVVMEQANRPEPARARYTPRSRNPVLYAGSDEVRRQQAREITARQRAKRNQ